MLTLKIGNLVIIRDK